MIRIILTIILAVSLLPSLNVMAFDLQSGNETIDNLASICDFKDDQKKSFKEQLEKSKFKDGSFDKTKVKEFAIKLQSNCVFSELSKRDKGEKYDHEKAEKFRVAIKPLREVEGQSLKFNSHVVAPTITDIILSLNSFVTPDNWTQFPDPTGRVSRDEQDINIAFTRAIAGSENKESNLIDVSSFIKNIASYVTVFLIICFIAYVFLAIFQKDKTGFLASKSISLLSKFGYAFGIPIIISILVVAFNLLAFIVLESVPKIDSCNNEKGVACLVRESNKEVSYVDFYLLPDGKFENKNEGQSKNFLDYAKDFKIEEAVQTILWSIYYIVIALIIGGSAFYLGCMFMSGQVIIYLQMIIWLIASYISLANPEHDFAESIKELISLFTSAFANVLGFASVLFLCNQVLKGGFSFQSITIIVIACTVSGTLFGYFGTVLKIKAMTKKETAFQYKTALKGASEKGQAVLSKAGELLPFGKEKKRKIKK